MSSSFRGFTSAARAYNDALERRNDCVAFVHQDVYLPESWMSGWKEPSVSGAARSNGGWAASA